MLPRPHSRPDSDREAYQEEMRLETGDYHRAEEFCALSTGHAALDNALAAGGYPKGTVCEWYGTAGAGKTTLALLAVAAAQRRGDTVAYFDLEGTLDPNYALSLGVAAERMIVLRPASAEDALSMSVTLVRAEAVSLIVYDSTAALCPADERNSTIGPAATGENWRKGVERLVFGVYNLLRARPCAALFVSQTRNYRNASGEMTEQSTGGLGLQRLASVRLASDIEKTDETGYLLSVRIEKGGKEGANEAVKIRRTYRS